MVKRHEALIYKVCLVFTRRRSDEVQDLKQEILCNLWRGYGGFRNQSKESTWIYKVALNTGLQYYRKLRRTPDFDSFDDVSSEPPAEPPGDADFADRLEQLYSLIRRLSDEERQLTLLYLDGVDRRETAQILGISPAHVSIRLFRIKEKLKKMAQR